MSGSRISVGASAIRRIRCSWSSCPRPRSRRPRKPKPPRRSLAADFRSRAGARRPRRKRRRLKRTPRPRPRRPRPRRRRRRRREQRPKTPHWRARVAYDGTSYAGFQVQPNARTVQGELEQAISTVCDEAVRVTGAGRTDAGVHASGQVIDFRTASALDGATIGRGVNALLPEDIAVSALEPAAEEFHARFSATGRTYEYRIRNAPERDPLERLREHHVDAALDVPAMREACASLLGRKDFSAFAAGPGGGRTSPSRPRGRE